MKTQITKTLAIGLAAIVMIATSASTSKAAEGKTAVTELTTVKNISNIVAKGNVEVILVQDNHENVKIYNKYYSKNALVQMDGNTLRISSYDKETLTVIVNVSNLSSIKADGDVVVKSFNQLSSVDLNIDLNHGAKANIDAFTYNMSTSVKDRSTLELAGFASVYSSVVNAKEQVNTNKFAAQRTDVKLNSALTTKTIAANIDADPFSL